MWRAGEWTLSPYLSVILVDNQNMIEINRNGESISFTSSTSAATLPAYEP